VTRAEKVALARRLRGGGLTVVEIAEQMGFARSTVGAYLSDPDLSKQKNRRARYSSPCAACGAPTDGSGGYKTRRRLCAECAAEQPHTLERARLHGDGVPQWTDEALLDALRAGDDLGIWTVKEWRRRAMALGLPSAHLFVLRFNSWNRARELAGLPVWEPRRSYSRTSTSDCVAAVARVWRALGEPPSKATYDAYMASADNRLPSESLIRLRVGSWVAALEAASFIVERELVPA
jgi:hypothetical protein